ncbi:hypothetical protein BKA60DRAFT_606178 [Fusarium oxysporum]|nr:hypothetical protein BKA60DRAFT_606178 [Fusarium oxysporum]
MEEHHVHHHHHHHYHYYYNHPFPPGLPSNAQGNGEPLNPEAAGRDDDEPSAEEDEEHSERGDTEEQHNPENRSPSPVQQEKSIKRIDIKRTGLAVFDGYFSVFNLDDQSVKAQARWTNAQPNSDDHQEGPPRKKARTSARPEQKNKPRQSSHITVIDKARIVATDPCIIASNGFYVANCDTSGPQVNICWRVPGPRNIWLARLAFRQDGENSEHPPSMSPGMTLSCFQKGPSGSESAWSTIMAKSGANVEERIGRGEGELAFGEPISEGGLVHIPNHQHSRHRPRDYGRQPAECDQVWPPQRRAPRSKTSEQKIDEQNETHAPSKDEVYDINPEYDDPKRNTGQNDANEEDTPNFEGHRPPPATFNLLRILPKVEIYARSTLFIRNPQESGPQTDICARIPGNDNNWAARVSCYDSLFDLYDWVRGNSSEESHEIWMYVSNIPHTFINIKDIPTVSLDEPGISTAVSQEKTLETRAYPEGERGFGARCSDQMDASSPSRHVGAFVPNKDSPATRLLLPPFDLHKPFWTFPYRSSLSLRVKHRFVRAQRSLRHEC